MAVSLVSLALSGCSSKPPVQAGVLGGPLDLKKFLPPSVQQADIPPEEAATVHRVKMATGPKCAPVEIEWRTFQAGNGKYLLSAQARLLEPVQYDWLTVGVKPWAPTGSEELTQIISLELNWSNDTAFSKSGGTDMIFLHGDGESKDESNCASKGGSR